MPKEKKLPLIDQQTLTQIITLVKEHWGDLAPDASNFEPRRFTIQYREIELGCVLSCVSSEERVSKPLTPRHWKSISGYLTGAYTSSLAKPALTESNFRLTLQVGETVVALADVRVSFHATLAPRSVRTFVREQGIQRFFWIQRKRLHTIEAYRGRGYGSILNILEDAIFQQWATCKQLSGVVYTNDDSVQRWTSATLVLMGYQPIKRGARAEVLRRIGITRIGKTSLGPRLVKVYRPQTLRDNGELILSCPSEGVCG